MQPVDERMRRVWYLAVYAWASGFGVGAYAYGAPLYLVLVLVCGGLIIHTYLQGH